VNPGIFFCVAFLLSIERICYLWIWRKAAAFRYWSARPIWAWIGAPVDILAVLFGGFKALQVAVFAGWCYVYGNGSLWPLNGTVPSLTAGALLIAIGQSLNIGVFYRLGKVGVFYGSKFGYRVPWQEGFPFSFFKHPQYVGTVLSIWGFFLLMRFPHNDWYVVPALESVYYGVGAYLERETTSLSSDPKPLLVQSMLRVAHSLSTHLRQR
jgi:phosphatidyl-N-methylethanolamine N-methyltransferase